jgi:hypothetical protein
MFYLIIISPFQISAEEDYLIVRVIDADYPPSRAIYEELNLTTFSFTLDYQVENPTHSHIEVTYLCAPFPFPRLKANLLNKSLEVRQLFIVEWVMGEYIIAPGLKNDRYIFAFDIIGYKNRSLPQGKYELWFDFTNCSSVPVPVVTEKLIIHIAQTNISYYFEYNNDTRIVSPRITIAANYSPFTLLISTIFVLIFIKDEYFKKKQNQKFDK